MLTLKKVQEIMLEIKNKAIIEILVTLHELGSLQKIIFLLRAQAYYAEIAMKPNYLSFSSLIDYLSNLSNNTV